MLLKVLLFKNEVKIKKIFSSLEVEEEKILNNNFVVNVDFSLLNNYSYYELESGKKIYIFEVSEEDKNFKLYIKNNVVKLVDKNLSTKEFELLKETSIAGYYFLQ